LHNLEKEKKNLENLQDNRNHKDSYWKRNDKRMIIDWSKDNETNTIVALI
jgi:hypothetical protein